MSENAGSNEPREGWRATKATYKKLPENNRFGGTNMSSKKSSRTVLGVKTSLIVRELECTSHAIFRSATNLAENDLSLEWTEDDDTEFDWKSLT